MRQVASNNSSTHKSIQLQLSICLRHKEENTLTKPDSEGSNSKLARLMWHESYVTDVGKKTKKDEGSIVKTN